MAKIVPQKKVGVPVPAEVPADTDHLTCYFGVEGFEPDYASEDQIDIPLANLEVRDIDGTNYWVFDTSLLPATPGDKLDLYFTLADAVGNENDFSPVIKVPLDKTPPPTLGQPVLLDG